MAEEQQESSQAEVEGERNRYNTKISDKQRGVVSCKWCPYLHECTLGVPAAALSVIEVADMQRRDRGHSLLANVSKLPSLHKEKKRLFSYWQGNREWQSQSFSLKEM